MAWIVAVVALLALGFWSMLNTPRGWVGRVLRWRSGSALLVGVALLLPFTIWHYRVTSAVESRIARLVAPYPGADDPQDAVRPLSLEPMMLAFQGDTAKARASVERLRASHGETYLMHTTDSPAAVMSFYRDPAHRGGWDIVEDDVVLLILGKGDGRLVIGASDEGYGRGTRIIYDLSGR
ncbi:MAG TPA: hypothetical protein VHM30_10490 [Gemmatimonadaceae bacterium]|nr:hypothetical protein [Gemmatimonadaceae bacterium]